MCDSRTSCKQYMASFRMEDNPFTDNSFVNFFRGINSAINSMFSSMLNHKNPVWQTCNIPITEDPEGVIIDPEPGGTMNTTTDGKGGA